MTDAEQIQALTDAVRDKVYRTKLTRLSVTEERALQSAETTVRLVTGGKYDSALDAANDAASLDLRWNGLPTYVEAVKIHVEASQILARALARFSDSGTG